VRLIHEHSWHSHDPKEIQEVCESCVAETIKKLESQGYAADSVKAIGKSIYSIPTHCALICSLGITNQRETTVAWSRKTGKQLCRAIVWDDGRTKAEVTFYEQKLADEGIEVKPGEFKKGPEAIRELYVISPFVQIHSSNNQSAAFKSIQSQFTCVGVPFTDVVLITCDILRA
jgi:glycerol kinase